MQAYHFAVHCMTLMALNFNVWVHATTIYQHLEVLSD